MLLRDNLIIFGAVTICCCCASLEPTVHQCVNDKVQPSMEDMIYVSEVDQSLSTDKTAGRTRKSKRETQEIKAMRLHIVFHPSTSDKPFFTDSKGAFQKATNYLSNALMVKPRRSSLTLMPRCLETIKSGPNAGKCKKLDKNKSMTCGPFTVPDELIGAGVKCKEKAGSCKSKGSSGPGVKADFILFAGAMDDVCANYGTSVLAFAGVCGIDSDHSRPAVGFINICYKNLLNSVDSVTEDIVQNVLLHEMGHAFGFTSPIMQTFFQNEQGNLYNPVSQFSFNGKTIPGMTSPKVLKYAREYFNCPNLQYVPLEDGGGSGSVSSHWEARVLNHEMLMPFLSSDYMLLSNFTWAFFEDSGWFKVNYEYANKANSLEMKWGKGLGCDFVTKPCTNNPSFPYTCQSHGCTFDRVSKGICSVHNQFFDGCRVNLPRRGGSCLNSKTSSTREIYSETSRCFEDRLANNVNTVSQVCLNTSVIHHPQSGTTAYKIQSTKTSAWCEDDKYKNIDGRLVNCPPIKHIAVQFPSITDVQTLPRQFCHDSCHDCVRPNNPFQCTSCRTGLQLNGPAPNSCCDSKKQKDCQSNLKPTATIFCKDGAIRLTNGITKYEGSVELCSNGQWGSVCHNNLYTLEAVVVCKQLGFSAIGSSSLCCSKFKQNTELPFVLDKVSCTGTENRLAECSHDNSQLQKCGAKTVAGVRCTGPCQNGETKLVSYYGSISQSSGRVAICQDSVFLPVCQHGWDLATASLFCKSLGKSPYGAMIDTHSSMHSSLLADRKYVSVSKCKGKKKFAECQISVSAEDCGDSLVSVVCQKAELTSDNCDHGDLRLLGNNTRTEGRVQVCFNRVWGDVCSYFWDNRDAKVACKQLGFSDGRAVSSSSRSEDIVLLNFVNCDGSEKRLIDCNSRYYSYCLSPATVQCT